MPNWCANSLKLAALNEQGKQTLQSIRDELAKAEPRFFNLILPVPDDLHIVAGRVGADDDPKQIALVAAEQANKAKHGYTTWYDFCVAEWGTKWEADIAKDDIEDDGDSITLRFDTAWSPPIGIYNKLTAMGLSVEATYCEGGVGYAGWWVDGEDNEHSISFWEGEDDDDIGNMAEWFIDRGLTHYPAHTGG